MTPEDKDLLLQDLCARLPYNPMVEYKSETYNVLGVVHGRLVICKPLSSLYEYPLVEEVKLYLFPLSSMTGEQKSSHNFLKNSAYANPISLIKFYHKNHFDCNRLIPKGFANDATNLNIY